MLAKQMQVLDMFGHIEGLCWTSAERMGKATDLHKTDRQNSNIPAASRTAVYAAD